MKIVRSTIIDAPLHRVWELLRDFNSHQAWHPGVMESQIEGERGGDEVGAIRRFRLQDGAELREQLLKLSDDQTTFTYAILDSPIPLREYIATVMLRPVTGSDQTFLDWRSSFRVPKGREQELADLVGNGVYETGIRGLKTFLRNLDQRSVARDSKRSIPVHVAANESVPTQAVMIDRPGDVTVMSLRETLVATPGAGEVRIRQTAIGVNYFDTYQRSGRYPLVSYPATLGVEAAGVIEDVGSGVVGFFPGDRVVYAQIPAGSYTGIRNVPADWCVAIPHDIEDEIAAASLLKGVTAELILHQVTQLAPDDVVLVHSAAGGLGSILTQWAKALGAVVIGTVSSEEKAKVARDLGCDWPIVRGQMDLVECVYEITKGRGADLVVDGIGTDTLDQSLQALARFGRLVSVGGSSGSPEKFDLDALAVKSGALIRPVYFHYADNSARLRAMAARFFGMVQQRRIRVLMHKVYALDEAAAAHQEIESGTTTGALILKP